jgi:hypothetical protein
VELKKISVLALAICLVAAFTVSSWAQVKTAPSKILTTPLHKGTVGSFTAGGQTSVIKGTCTSNGGYSIPLQTFSKPGVFSGSISGTVTK